MSLKNKFITGVFWSGIGRFSSLGIQFIVSIILARILGPYAYGIIGILTVFVAIAQIITDSGFGQALIQKGENSQIDYSSVFFLNLFIGIFLYGLLYIFAPYLDTFYQIKNLGEYARIIFLIIPINSIGLIPRTLMQKDLEFKKISIIELCSALFSGIIGILLAYFKFEIFALIAQMLTINILRTLLSILVKKWLPTLKFSILTIKKLFTYGVNLMLTSLLTVIFNNIHTLIIGKYYSAINVGYYNQAKQYEQITSNTVTDIVLSVSFPALVKFKGDLLALKLAYKKIIEMVIFLIAPLMIGLLSFSYELFEVILTEKWIAAVPYFNILCIYGSTFPLHQINSNIFKVLGESKTLLYLELFRRIVLILSIVLTISISIEALLYGQVISMLVVIVVSMYYSGRLIGYKIKDQLKDIYIYYVITVISVLLSYSFKCVFHMDSLFTIIYMIISIMSFYLIGCYIFKTQAINIFLSIIKEHIYQRRK